MDIVFFHHLRSQTIDGVLYPRFFSVNENGLAFSIGVFADLVNSSMNALAFRLALSIKPALVAHAFERAQWSDTGHLENREWNVWVLFCPVNGSNYFVFSVVEVLFGRFAFYGIIKDRPDLCCGKFLDSWFAFFDRFAAAELFEDRRLDQAFDRQPKRKRELSGPSAKSIQQRRIQHSEEPVFFF